MAQRTDALCNGKYIGIESIYTVIDGQQINIPEKLKEFRVKSQRNELFCPCGCGANLILVAGDKNLREQHFRIKDNGFNQECHVITEGKISVDSKIVLKCWLDDKIAAADMETRVPIQAVDDINRKYEFSFLSRDKKIALSYCHERVNLSDEKLSILEKNSQNIHIIYVVDSMNGGSVGQYPEGLMKVQNKQGYCLLLSIEGSDYSKAELEAVFYARDIDGLWKEIPIAVGLLKNFDINAGGMVIYSGHSLDEMLETAKTKFLADLEKERIKRADEKKRRMEELKRIQEEQERLQEEYHRQQEEKRRAKEEKHQAEKQQLDENFKRNMESNFSQQETPIRDAEGNRWIKCEFCGKIAMENEFSSYGGVGHINLGTCRECLAYNPAVKEKTEKENAMIRKKYDSAICPECGGKLHERRGPYGSFMGCSNYPKCRYTQRR